MKYKFEFKIEINDETSEDYSNDAFSYLKKFILNFPKFKLNIQPNLKDKPYSNIFKQDDNDEPKSEKKDETDETKFRTEKQIDTKIQNSNNELNKDNEFRFERDEEKDNNFIEVKCSLSQKIIDFTSKFNEKDKDKMFDIKEFNVEKKHNQTLKIFDDPSDLFDFVVHDFDSKSESKLKIIFINEIRDIINIMNDILYTEPYPILFGRIRIKEPKKEEEKQVDRREIIDQSFYEGFGI